MAVKDVISRGIGPGSVAYFVTGGFGLYDEVVQQRATGGIMDFFKRPELGEQEITKILQAFLDKIA